ncbi:MAG: ATP-binding protein [Clostridium sp.]|nr:ATP-binding protein [Bacteroides sp.]MCM1198204.1 ATP-binding protein [Clostridium sp.]
MDYGNIQKAQAEPMASSMIETFRAIGYSLETAVADIIDNSISAEAKNIFIRRKWKGGQSIISIADDGIGMSSNELIQAMRPGSQNPLDSRSTKDLGRFGLGLKTASFSQCRRITVLSKKKGEMPVYWTWDLNYVKETNRWELIKWIPDGFENTLDNTESGTVVIWTDLDRIISPSATEYEESAKMKFSQSLDKVKNHLSMIFHRFIEEKQISIFWEEHKIDAWNPFCLSEKKTQCQPTENIRGGVCVKGYVLPHQNNFSDDKAYKAAQGMNGWTGHQGFYVYRGKRLLLAGDWLGFFKKEEHYKLVRIQVDLPNTLDTEWQIDIKKSRAYPPSYCREQLEAYAKSVRQIGAEVYRHRGRILKQRAGTSFQPLWLEKKKEDKWSFVVNRENEIVKTAKILARENPDKAIETLIKYIEESIPSPSIFIKEAESKGTPIAPFSEFDSGLINEMLCMVYANKLSEGYTEAQAKSYLKTIEPFNNYEHLIDTL